MKVVGSLRIPPDPTNVVDVGSILEKLDFLGADAGKIVEKLDTVLVITVRVTEAKGAAAALQPGKDYHQKLAEAVKVTSSLEAQETIGRGQLMDEIRTVLLGVIDINHAMEIRMDYKDNLDALDGQVIDHLLAANTLLRERHSISGDFSMAGSYLSHFAADCGVKKEYTRMGASLPWGASGPADPRDVVKVYFERFIRMISSIGGPGELSPLKWFSKRRF